jgi:hypothetical protein
MAATVAAAPYETAITAGFNALSETMGWLETITPALVKFVAENVALHKAAKEQRIMDRRIRRCKRICRENKYDSAQIRVQINFDFTDLTTAQQAELALLITAANGANK